MRNKILIFFLISIMVITASCTREEAIEKSEGPSELKEGKVTEGGEISLPLTTIGGLNPITNQNESYYYFSKLIYEGLFDFDENLDLLPELAESYEIKEEGRLIDIKLRGDVYWHNGSKFTAEDVIYTIDLIKSAGESSFYGSLWTKGLGSYSPINIKRILLAEGSGQDLRISFDKAFSNNLEILTFPIVSSSLGDFKAGLAQDGYQVMGTGPYRFKSYENKKGIILEANEDYRKGRPHIDRINGKIFKDREEINTAFETGQIGILSSKGMDWEKYTQSDSIRLREYVSSNYEFLGFNFRREIFQGEEGHGLRQLIENLVPREDILEKAYLDHGEVSLSPINPRSWLYNEGLKSDYDLNKARKGLKALGYKEKDSEGYFLKENKERLELTLLTNTLNPMRYAAAKIIQQNLKEVGIYLSIIPEVDQKTVKRTEEAIGQQWEEVDAMRRRGEYDMILSGWDLSIVPDLSFMFHSEEIGSGNNFIAYSNEEMDKLLYETFHSGNSREEKKANYDKLQELIMEELPYISILYRNNALLLNKSIEGDIRPTFVNPYRGIEGLYLKS